MVSPIAPNIETSSAVTVLAATPDLIAVNKPAGLHSAPLQPSEMGTVLNAVVALYPECAAPVGKKSLEGTLLHRLDRGTSGVLVFARSAASYSKLRDLWTHRRILKDYLAWVEGPCTVRGTISIPLAHSPKSKKRMVVVPPAQLKKFKYWDAVSSIEPLVVGEQSLVLVRIHTGVTHQIRATLAALGHPVLEDPIYRAASKPLPLDMVTHFDKTLTNQMKTIHDKLIGSLKVWPPSMQPELLPEHGFFLHALRLQTATPANGEFAILDEGIEAPPPTWVGWLPR